MEAIEHSLNGNPEFGRRSSVCITRNGDLITKIYLMVKVDRVCPSEGAKFAWVRKLGYALIKSVEVEIGGSRIDKQYGTWLQIWYELAHHAGDNERGFRKMIGDTWELTAYNHHVKPCYVMYIPLMFWFNRHVGLALPLIALQYHEVRLHFEFHDVCHLVVTNKQFRCHDMKQLCMKDAQILVDYIYLDSEERRRFAQVGHEYLIEQVQFTGIESIHNTSQKYKLDFNHPTKELIWAMKNGNYTTGKAFLCYTHHNRWERILDECACKILQESVALLDADCTEDDGYGNKIVISTGECCPDGGTWEEFLPGSHGLLTENGKITVNNHSRHKSLWVNTNSLSVGAYSLTNKIFGTITVDENNNITCSNISSDLTVRDLSIPVDCMTDCRYAPQVDDVFVYQPFNFGIFIDGTGIPFEFGLIQLNGHDRFDRREGAYFNYVQTDEFHTNTPSDGVQVYSFALYPEQHQPSGTCNLSRIDNTQLNLWLIDSSKDGFVGCVERCVINYCNSCDNKLYIYAFSYNVLRIMSKNLYFPAWKSSRSWVCGYPMIVQLNLPLLMITTSQTNSICSMATSSNCRNFLDSYVLNHKVNFMMRSNIHVSRITEQPSSLNEDAVQRLNVDGFWDLQNLRYSLVSMRKDRVWDSFESLSGNGWSKQPSKV
jgi:hypothetical protein